MKIWDCIGCLDLSPAPYTKISTFGICVPATCASIKQSRTHQHIASHLLVSFCVPCHHRCIYTQAWLLMDIPHDQPSDAGQLVQIATGCKPGQARLARPGPARPGRASLLAPELEAAHAHGGLLRAALAHDDEAEVAVLVARDGGQREVEAAGRGQVVVRHHVVQLHPRLLVVGPRQDPLRGRLVLAAGPRERLQLVEVQADGHGQRQLHPLPVHVVGAHRGGGAHAAGEARRVRVGRGHHAREGVVIKQRPGHLTV
mmetsp:Transcript_37368/g.94259  ORF Transcript_37368/g.94259 Transcript_37368/m.94259 type:complete len:257 (-) Transcript_37368:596-1366(-)